MLGTAYPTAQLHIPEYLNIRYKYLFNISGTLYKYASIQFCHKNNRNNCRYYVALCASYYSFHPA
jgi:hypothetical protein